MKSPPAQVFRAVNGSPSENMEKVISMMGGVESLIGADDVVLIKPNLQWFNQGAPNIASLNALTALILERKAGFRGEVVWMENIHRGSRPWEKGGWSTPFARNSDLPGISNYNDLARRLKKSYGNRFSVCHLIDTDCGAPRVTSPADGPGYVFCDGTGGVPLFSMDNGRTGKDRRSVILSYPIVRTDPGTVVDYFLGVWERGFYTQRPVKFINFAALNHHSAFCGMTGAVKNYLGVCDLSGGSDPFAGGKMTGSFHNFHSFAFNQSKKGPVPGMLGAEIGYFLKTIRRPFLNIITASECGIVDRTRPPVARTRTIAASTDPVALDFHMAKYVLYPNSRISGHDPENPKSPTHQYLEQCALRGDYCFDESQVAVHSHDLGKDSRQSEKDWIVRRKKEWGGNIRSRLKYFVFRSRGSR